MYFFAIFYTFYCYLLSINLNLKMSNNDIQTCAFDSNECNGKINIVGDKVSIPSTNIELISCGIFLCMFHYNKFILNEKYRLEKFYKFVLIQNMKSILINQINHLKNKILA